MNAGPVLLCKFKTKLCHDFTISSSLKYHESNRPTISGYFLVNYLEKNQSDVCVTRIIKIIDSVVDLDKTNRKLRDRLLY